MRALPIAAGVAAAVTLAVSPLAFAGDYQGDDSNNHHRSHTHHTRHCEDRASDSSLLTLNLGALSNSLNGVLNDNDNNSGNLRLDALRDQKQRLCKTVSDD